MPTIGEAGNSYYIPVNLQNSEKAAAGDMSKESALAVIKIAFPNISESEIAQLTSGMEKIPAKTTPQEVD